MESVLNIFITAFSSCVGWFNALFGKLEAWPFYLACITLFGFYAILIKPMVAGRGGGLIVNTFSKNKNKGNNNKGNNNKGG